MGLSLGAFVGAYLVGCDDSSHQKSVKHMDITLSPFSKANLHEKLDRLLSAFESKGMKVSDTLLPSVSESALRKQCSWFPGELTEEIIALYGWRGGQKNDAWETEYPFWFRDNSFCSLERAEREYKSMMETYGTIEQDHHMLKHAFPIASFNGGWYVIPTKGHNLNLALEKPVISVLEGIDIYFYSLEKMVETCIEWVQHKNYKKDGLFPAEVELEIWRKHNPGIFEWT